MSGYKRLYNWIKQFSKNWYWNIHEAIITCVWEGFAQLIPAGADNRLHKVGILLDLLCKMEFKVRHLEIFYYVLLVKLSLSPHLSTVNPFYMLWESKVFHLFEIWYCFSNSICYWPYTYEIVLNNKIIMLVNNLIQKYKQNFYLIYLY